MVVLAAPFSQVSGTPVAVSGEPTQSVTGGSGLRSIGNGNKPRTTRWAGNHPPAEPRWEDGHLLPSADRSSAWNSTATPASGTRPGGTEPPHLTRRDGSFTNR